MVPLVAFSLLRVAVVPAYWLVALPGPWLITGAAAEALARTRFMRIVSVAIPAGAILFALLSLRYLHSYHKVLERGDASMQKYPSYRDQRDVTAHIHTASAGQPALIRQDGRSIKGGIDYQLLYLLAMFDPETERFSSNNPESKRVCYWIVNRARALPPPLAGVLRSLPARRFGLLDVYEEKIPPAASGH